MVGAGIAGLAAARELADAGHDVSVFEKSRGVGGRIATRRADGAVFDHGSRVVAAPAGSALRLLIDRLDPADRVDLMEGVAFTSGATRLAKLMAEGLAVHLGVRLAALRAASGGLELGDEQGNTHGIAQAVVVTAPAPQAADLLDRSPEAGPRVASLRAVAYSPAVMILMGLPAMDEEDREVIGGTGGPIAEVRRDVVKGRSAIEGVEPVVVRLDEAVSAELIDESDEIVVTRTLADLARLVGDEAATPAWAQVKRWRYAVPVGPGDVHSINPPGTRIVVAGDTLTGAGFGSPDHHRVYDSGVHAARRVMA